MTPLSQLRQPAGNPVGVAVAGRGRGNEGCQISQQGRFGRLRGRSWIPQVLDVGDPNGGAILRGVQPPHGHAGVRGVAHDIRGTPATAAWPAVPDGNHHVAMPHDIAADGLVGTIHLWSTIAVQRQPVLAGLRQQTAELGEVFRGVKIPLVFGLREGHGHVQRVAKCQRRPCRQPVRAARQWAYLAQGRNQDRPGGMVIGGGHAAIARCEILHRLTCGAQHVLKLVRQAWQLCRIQAACPSDADAKGQRRPRGIVGGAHRTPFDLSGAGTVSVRTLASDTPSGPGGTRHDRIAEPRRTTNSRALVPGCDTKGMSCCLLANVSPP